MRTLLLTLPLFLCACAGAAPNDDDGLESGPTPVRAVPVAASSGTGASSSDGWRPPDGWRELGPLRFERMVLAELPAGPVRALDPSALEELSTALANADDAALRAAVILGRSRSDEAAEVLIARLEERVTSEVRGGDAADVVAAAALRDFPNAERFAGRLEALGAGNAAHPDLEVRVECAASALALGRERGVVFLWKVLRIDTWQGREDERDFESSTTTAWARGRAAIALSAHAGVPVTYRADASIADREAAANALARALEIDF